MFATKILRTVLCTGKGIIFALLLTGGAAHATLIPCVVGPCIQPIVVLSFDPGYQAVKRGQNFDLKVYVNRVDLLPSYAKLLDYDIGVKWDRNVAWLQSETFGDFGGIGGTTPPTVTPCPNCFSGFVHFSQGTQGDTTKEPGTFLLFDMFFSALGNFGETQFNFGEVYLEDTTGTSGPINGSVQADDVVAVDVVPEPPTLALFGISFAGVAFFTRRRRHCFPSA